MKLTFDAARWTMDEKGFWLCLNVKETAQARAFVQNKKDRPYAADIKEHRKGRSLTANAYLWVLCQKLGEALSIPAQEVYRRAIRESGLWRDLDIDQKAVGTIEHIWSAHGLGWFTEQVDQLPDGRVTLRMYYGSSSYNTKQMARLVDNIIEECRQQEIETMTPRELSLLYDQWEELYAQENKGAGDPATGQKSRMAT